MNRIDLESNILSYLRQQEECPEISRSKFKDDSATTKADAESESLLNKILLKVDQKIICKEKYAEKAKRHNQYPLFDLQDTIPDFKYDKNIFEKLPFRETLLISNIDAETPLTVGALCLNIQAAPGRQSFHKKHSPSDTQLVEICQNFKEVLSNSVTTLDERTHWELLLKKKVKEYDDYLNKEMQLQHEKFIVHLSSQFNVDLNAGSRITAWVDREFHTLEEKRTEYICQEGDSEADEKSLYVAMEAKRYYVSHKHKGDNISNHKYYSLVKAKDFIGEGANFVLMRYLALIRYFGIFELSAMYINGNMCRNIYECNGPEKVNVSGKKLDGCKVYRTVIERCGIEHRSVTILTLNGQILLQEWEGCPFVLNINPLLIVDNDKVTNFSRFALKHTWRDDMQLLSKYLDFKNSAEHNIKAYIKDHSEIKLIMSDYVQNILLLKPSNILNFTIDYFKEFAPFELGRIRYFEQGEKYPLEVEDNQEEDDDDDEDTET